MLTFGRTFFSSLFALWLGSCASLEYLHDPQFGFVSREQLPKFLKSVRCELVTFYDANRRRAKSYAATAANDPKTAAEKYAYFPVKDDLFGLFFVDLKVQDTLGLPAAGSLFDEKSNRIANVSKTWHFGPNLTDQGTYEFQWSFALQQDARVSSASALKVADASNEIYPELGGFGCYSGIDESTDRDALANHLYPAAEHFTRIMVNGVTPLAAWLQSNSSVMSTALLDDLHHSEEAIFPAQMFYTFTVQVTGGVDAKFTLVSPTWNPLAPDISASIQHTNNLQIFINGDKAQGANGAKAGSSSWVPPKTVVAHVIVDKLPPEKGAHIESLPGQTGAAPPPPAEGREAEVAKKLSTKRAQKPKALSGQQVSPSTPKYLDRGTGYLMGPLAVPAPAPLPQQ